METTASEASDHTSKLDQLLAAANQPSQLDFYFAPSHSVEPGASALRVAVNGAAPLVLQDSRFADLASAAPTIDTDGAPEVLG